jgi:uroporphyrinogen decarboxylase
MTSKERVQRAINREVPDRIPIDLGSTNCTTMTLKAYSDLKKKLGIQSEDSFIMYNFQIVKIDEEILKILDIDTRGIHGRPGKNSIREKIDGRTYVSEWGITYHMPEGGLYYDMIRNPLRNATVDDVDSFHFPDPDDPECVRGLRDKALKLHSEKKYALVGDMVETGIFEPCWYLRGFDQFLMDLIVNKEFVHRLMSRMVEVQLRRYERFLEEVGEFLDIVFVGDDLATADNTIMSPALYREMVKPYQKEYLAGIKKMTSAKLMYHSCGNIFDFIDDLVEMGVDILNPVQVNAQGMDTERLKQSYGDKLCFWGGIDTSYVLPRGTEEEVESEVKKRIDELGPEGYVLNAVHDIQPDVPGENVITMFKAARRYGVLKN